MLFFCRWEVVFGPFFSLNISIKELLKFHCQILNCTECLHMKKIVQYFLIINHYHLDIVNLNSILSICFHNPCVPQMTAFSYKIWVSKLKTKQKFILHFLARLFYVTLNKIIRMVYKLSKFGSLYFISFRFMVLGYDFDLE